MKKIITTAIILVLALAIPALAITNDEALTTAQTYVPSDAAYQRTETDDGLFEVKYLSADGSEEYDVKIDRNSGIVVKVERDLRDGRGSNEVVLTEDEARALVQNLYPEATIISLRSERDDDLYEYQASFSTEEFFGTIELNAETGVVLEADIYYNAAVPEGQLGYAEIMAQLESLKPGLNVIRIEFDEDDGRMRYEGEALLDNVLYEFEIDADTGELREWEREN